MNLWMCKASLWRILESDIQDLAGIKWDHILKITIRKKARVSPAHLTYAPTYLPVKHSYNRLAALLGLIPVSFFLL